MYFLYMLRGPRNHLYTGVSKNITSRKLRHEKGWGAEFTKRNEVFTLVYFEKFKTLKQARQREAQIKKWRREKKENLIQFGHPYIPTN